jgi:prepilin-type N-terminal cleavage/methylation domain-containing protein
MKQLNNKGFTLVELLVVVAIIALLSTFAIVALGSARARTRDVKRFATVREIGNALEMYFNENNSYPIVPDANGIVLGEKNAQVLCAEPEGFFSDVSQCNKSNVYMAVVPKAPVPPSGQKFVYVSLDGDGNVCVAGDKDQCEDYKIVFALEGELSGYSGCLKGTPAGIVEAPNDPFCP